MPSEIAINDRRIGPKHRPLVIAEIGINHGGSIDVAKRMVELAAEAGAEVIKHQTHVIEDEMSASAKAIKPGNSDNSIYDIMHSCALSPDEEYELKEFVEEHLLTYLSTPFSRAAANQLQQWNVPAFKIGSGECNNIPLLKHIASFGKPMLVSTGMNTIETVAGVTELLRSFQIDFALLHTTNLYPTPNHLVRLGAMQEMMDKFSDFAPIGLSDHTVTNHACFAAVALGASLVERHFTDTMEREGPDIINSMDPRALKELIYGVNIIWEMRGGSKQPAAEEKVTSDFAFATVVTTKSVAKGEQFSEENIWVKRPGKDGLPAADYERVIGKFATKNLEADTHVQTSDVEGFE